MFSGATTASSPTLDTKGPPGRIRSRVLICGYNAAMSDSREQQSSSSRLVDAPTTLVAAVVLLPSLVRSIPSYLAELYTEFLGNMLFFLYVCKNFLNELWDLEKATADRIAGPLHKQRDEPANVPNLLECRDVSDASKVIVSITGDREWFLSEQSFPEATQAERRRFLNARDGDVPAACTMLKNYLEWRKQFDLVEHELMLDRSKDVASAEDPDWTLACRMASLVSSSTPLRVIPPCILFMPDKNNIDSINRQSKLHTLDGKRVLQHLPARIDLSTANAHVYATALALYVDRCVSRDSTEKICVVIDTRPGKGWGNIPAPRLIPFIKHAAGLLNNLHPERLARCILFPVPSVATFLWNAVKPWLDPDTADKICILSGSAGMKSPIPTDMQSYLEKDVVEWMERKRLSTFQDGAVKRKLEEKLESSLAST